MFWDSLSGSRSVNTSQHWQLALRVAELSPPFPLLPLPTFGCFLRFDLCTGVLPSFR